MPAAAAKPGAEQHQQQVARRPGDQTGDHGRDPSEKAFSAAFRLLSASTRKLPETTTDSPSATAVANLHIGVAALAELDVARLQPTLSLVDEDGLPAAAIHDGA